MRHGGQKTSRECAPLLWKLLSILRVTRSFARAFLELLACNAAIRYVTAYVAGVGDCATQLPAAAALLMPLLLHANFDISGARCKILFGSSSTPHVTWAQKCNN